MSDQTNLNPRPRLISYNFDPEYDRDDGPDANDLRELNRAVCAGDLERVKRAIKPETDLTVQFGSSYLADSLLSDAILHSHMHIVGFLLALGADPATPSCTSQRQALHDAAELGNVEAVRLFLDLGADVNSVCETDGFSGGHTTALWLAIHRGGEMGSRHWPPGADPQRLYTKKWVETIELLLARGAHFPPRPPSDPYFNPSFFDPPIPSDEATLVGLIPPYFRIGFSNY